MSEPKRGDAMKSQELRPGEWIDKDGYIRDKDGHYRMFVGPFTSSAPPPPPIPEPPDDGRWHVTHDVAHGCCYGVNLVRGDDRIEIGLHSEAKDIALAERMAAFLNQDGSAAP